MFFPGKDIGFERVLPLKKISGRTVKYEAYETRQVAGDFDAMEFYSHGKNGVILKRAIFTHMGPKDVYNLGFGSVDEMMR